MGKRVYISADYSASDGDRDVVDVLHQWSEDNYRVIEFSDTACVVSGSVSRNPDCRACDLKEEFNEQINVSSIVVFIIGDKTASRTAGNSCKRILEGEGCPCTPYKQNANGASVCKICGKTVPVGPDDNVGKINSYSYLEHEFRQAQKMSKKMGKKIVIVYNSLNKQPSWLPSYMKSYENVAHPFWKKDAAGRVVGDYQFIKQALGY